MVLNKKYIYLLLLVLVGFGGWWFFGNTSFNVNVSQPPVSNTPPITTTNTEGFKTYRNTEFGFEFQYPNGWSIHINKFGSPFSKFNLIGASPTEKNIPDIIDPSFFINVVTPDFASKTSSQFKGIDVVVAGISGKKYEYNFEGSADIAVDLPFGKYHILSGARKVYENIFNQILASFKFIDSSQFKNATYEIDGKNVTLVDGVSEIADTPGSASKIITKYFGNEVSGDLNGDGLSDIGFLLTQNSGGSGTFYYAVVALKTSAGYKGTNAVLLGDRIAPQTMEIQNGILIANYADRKPNEPMTAQPSVGKSKYLEVNGGKLTEAPIFVRVPAKNTMISSPLTVTGVAKGNWFFEASFPVNLKDAAGKVIAQIPAQAQSDWMTTEYVPFSVTFIFPKQPAGSKGTLIVKKDNPSGLPEYEDSREIPVIFK